MLVVIFSIVVIIAIISVAIYMTSKDDSKSPAPPVGNPLSVGTPPPLNVNAPSPLTTGDSSLDLSTAVMPESDLGSELPSNEDPVLPSDDPVLSNEELPSSPVPIDCVQGPWTNFGNCVSGSQTQMRETLTKSANGGKACGPSTQSVSCVNIPVKHGRYVYVGRDSGCLNIAEVEVMSNGVDVARGKSVSASSIYLNDVANYGPQHVTDGNPATFAHTNCDTPHEYLYIDLGKVFPINSVRIVHRQGCCYDRLHNIVVVIGDSNQKPVWSVRTRPAANATEVVYSVESTGWRYVVLGRKEGCLNIASIEVMSNGVDVARGKSVKMSSLLLGNSDWDGSKVTDGNLATFAHTNCNNTHEWIEVDLGQQTKIDSVRIVNRQDCCPERFKNVDVVLMDENKQEKREFVTNPATGEIEATFVIS